MKKLNIISSIVLLGLIFFGISCTEGWEELNEDPNNPSKAPATNILAHTLRVTGDAFFDDWQDMNNFMSYAGHVTKIQYIDEAKYDYRESVVNTAWTDYYTLQLDLQKMRNIAEEQNKPKTYAVAEVFSVYLWQFMTDMWKAIPYENSLGGEDGNFQPEYTDQQTIYMDLLSRLDSANQALNQPVNEANPDNLGAGDVLYNGDKTKWQKFCNSLRLRIAMRISKVDPETAQNVVESILTDPDNNPIFESNDDNAYLWWPGAAPYKEPWAENLETRDDHGMAKTMVQKLKDLDDPRLKVYAKPNENGEYVGVVEGAAEGSFQTSNISRLGTKYREDPAGFTPFMRYAETMFNVAEAALLGWNTGSYTAQSAYEAGVEGSLIENSTHKGETLITEDEITQYMNQPEVSFNGTLRQVYIQKWISLFKQGREAWSLTRRTDVPVMPPAEASVYEGHNRQPFRYPYPTQEKNLNTSNWEAFSADIVDQYWGQQMWWDTRTGVQ
jgi:hypothetical protein